MKTCKATSIVIARQLQADSQQAVGDFFNNINTFLIPQLGYLTILLHDHNCEADLKDYIRVIANEFDQQIRDRFDSSIARFFFNKFTNAAEKAIENNCQCELCRKKKASINPDFKEEFKKWGEVVIKILKNTNQKYPWFDYNPIAKVLLNLKVENDENSPSNT